MVKKSGILEKSFFDKFYKNVIKNITLKLITPNLYTECLEYVKK